MMDDLAVTFSLDTAAFQALLDQAWRELRDSTVAKWARLASPDATSGTVTIPGGVGLAAAASADLAYSFQLVRRSMEEVGEVCAASAGAATGDGAALIALLMPFVGTASDAIDNLEEYMRAARPVSRPPRPEPREPRRLQRIEQRAWRWKWSPMYGRR